MLREGLRGGGRFSTGAVAGMMNMTSRRGGMRGMGDLSTIDWTTLGSQLISAVAANSGPGPTVYQGTPPYIPPQQPAQVVAGAPVDHTVLYVVLGLGVAAAIGGAVYFSRKK
jgi:hypothetical protein